MKAPDHRRRELAVIHILKKQLGLDEETYRSMLLTLTRKASSGDLDDAERQVVIKHMEARGGVTTANARRNARRRAAGTGKPQVSADKAALIDKIDALLKDGDRPWNYARAMAKRMFKVDAIEFASAAQLHSIVAALEYQKARGWKSKTAP